MDTELTLDLDMVFETTRIFRELIEIFQILRKYLEAKPVKDYMDGRVMMTRLVIITATCDLGLNVNDYPFDKHKCPLSQGKNFDFQMIEYIPMKNHLQTP